MEGGRSWKAQDHPSIVCFLYSVYMQRVVLLTWCQDLTSTRIFLAESQEGPCTMLTPFARKNRRSCLHCPTNSSCLTYIFGRFSQYATGSMVYLLGNEVDRWYTVDSRELEPSREIEKRSSYRELEENSREYGKKTVFTAQ